MRARGHLKRTGQRPAKWPRGRTPRPHAHSELGRRRGAGDIGRHPACGPKRAGRRTTEGHRTPTPTYPLQNRYEGYHHQRTSEHPHPQTDIYRGRGVRGERGRAGPRIKTPGPKAGHRSAPKGRAGRGSARGSGQGRAPRTFARRSGAGARRTLPTSTQRAPNEHSRPSIRGIMAFP